jgi:large subunit ribosomal protein L5
MAENKMRDFKLEKVVLNIGATGDDLEKGVILLERVSGKKPMKVKATKRIPAWSVRPGLEVGVKVTLRGAEAKKILMKLLPAVDNKIKSKQIQDNFFSFGIHEYIEIPGIEYIREVGVMGLEVTVVFVRAGKYVEKRKIKRSKSKKTKVSAEEISNYLKETFKTEILEGKK